MTLYIAPSILSADFSALGDAVATVERGGADLIHVDVMDGHFVPNITIGPVVVASLKRVARRPLDVHLMISDPDRYIGAFAEAGDRSTGISTREGGNAVSERTTSTGHPAPRTTRSAVEPRKARWIAPASEAPTTIRSAWTRRASSTISWWGAPRARHR